MIWTHNDSGDVARLFALDTAGRHLGLFTLPDVEAVDWEDMACGPGPLAGQSYLYIGDFGDNAAERDVKTVYRVPEPELRLDQEPLERELPGVVAIRFRFPDGPRDAETLIVDPVSADIIIVSKRERAVGVYLAPAPQPTNEIITLQRMGTLAMTNVVAGDISPTGRELLLKTHVRVLYWQREPAQPIWEALLQEPAMLAYIPEPQGEAVTWAWDEMSYFTLSEERNGTAAVLHRYPRLPTSLGDGVDGGSR